MDLPDVGKSLQIIEAAFDYADSPALAYSGGKDSVVVGLLLRELGLTVPGVCEVSFCFSRQIEDFRENAEKLGHNIEFRKSLDDEFLHKHDELIFGGSAEKRGWYYSVRQQKTVKDFAEENGHDCQIFGRRTEDNTVKDYLYETSAGLQCHPVRDWNEHQVVAYIRQSDVVDMPWIYSTRWSKLYGAQQNVAGNYGANGPFNLLKTKGLNGGLDTCWELVNELDVDDNFEERFRYRW